MFKLYAIAYNLNIGLPIEKMEKENMESKGKFTPLFLEFLSAVVIGIPQAFLNASPIYRAMRRSGLKRRQIDRGIRNLHHRGYIAKRGDSYVLTSRGKRWAISHQYRYYKQ